MSERKNSTYTIGMKLRFGKYDGQLVKNVIRKNPSYITWCLNNIEWFRLGKEAAKAHKNALAQKNREVKRSRHNKREAPSASQQGHLDCFGHTGPDGGWGNGI